MKSIFTWFLGVLTLISSVAFAQRTDLSKQKVLYIVVYSHLDTQWRWDYKATIDNYLWNTLEGNFRSIEKFPGYVFNFTGANRYMFMKEYYPAQFDSVKMYVSRGRWFPSGSSMEENDVLLSSAESDIRQILYGNQFFRKEFGKAGNDFMLPDCFGFPASLPSILAHCGIKGFSTQKLTWKSAVGIPFNVGRWIGPDGESVVAGLNAGPYVTRRMTNLAKDSTRVARVNMLGAETGVYADYLYYGTGDTGGPLKDSLLMWLDRSVRDTTGITVLPTRADQMFLDITPSEKEKLPSYTGELLLTEHSAGAINSAAAVKKWNRKNEFLAYNAEASSVLGSWLGATRYDRDKLNKAWRLVLATQFHDMLPGTVIPKGFQYMWNDELLAANQFGNIFTEATGSVARGLDTRGQGVTVVVFNPLSINRQDVVEATVSFDGVPPEQVVVFDHTGKEIPSQVQRVKGKNVTVLFLATTPSLSCSTFDVRRSKHASNFSTGLKVTSSALENENYTVKLNGDGDVASIYDKHAKKELLSSPIRLAFQYEKPRSTPAWNMDWVDRKMPPVGFVDGPAQIKIVENGPVRIGIEVTREARHSKFVQEIRLSAGEAGDRVEFKTDVDWATHESSLKATFPLTVSNPIATYNFEVGKVQRGNNDSLKYEVPSHQWFDLTDIDGKYGVSILEDCKYGSDKPADSVVRLTLLYTPGVREAYNRYWDQTYQDFGKHQMLYAVYGHRGDWRDGSSNLVAHRVNQPLFAFQTVHHEGSLGRSLSFLKINNPNIDVLALKKAEDSEQIVVRVVESKGESWKDVEMSFANPIISAEEVDGQERHLKPATVRNGKLVFDETPYHLRTFMLRLKPPKVSLSLPESAPLQLPYNVIATSLRGKVVRNGGFDGAGRTYPSEQLPDTVKSEDIHFVLGPRGDGLNNAVACNGQTIELPEGRFNCLYILAASTDTLRDAEFKFGEKSVSVPVEAWSGFIGQWDDRIWDKEATSRAQNFTWLGINYLGMKPGYVRRDNVGFFTQYRHLSDGTNDAYAYAYMYKYRLNIPNGTKKIVLPNHEKIRIFAMTVANNENDNILPAQPLFDSLNNKEGYERFNATEADRHSK